MSAPPPIFLANRLHGFGLNHGSQALSHKWPGVGGLDRVWALPLGRWLRFCTSSPILIALEMGGAGRKSPIFFGSGGWETRKVSSILAHWSSPAGVATLPPCSMAGLSDSAPGRERERERWMPCLALAPCPGLRPPFLPHPAHPFLECLDFGERQNCRGSRPGWASSQKGNGACETGCS